MATITSQQAALGASLKPMSDQAREKQLASELRAYAKVKSRTSTSKTLTSVVLDDCLLRPEVPVALDQGIADLASLQAGTHGLCGGGGHQFTEPEAQDLHVQLCSPNHYHVPLAFSRAVSLEFTSTARGCEWGEGM